MRMEQFLQSMCTQDAVYWGNPQEDGFGGKTFDDPIAIKCRWQDKVQLLGTPDKETVISRATVVVLQDLQEDGLLWLGSLSSLTTEQRNNPRKIDHMCIVKRPEKTPALGSTTFPVCPTLMLPLVIVICGQLRINPGNILFIVGTITVFVFCSIIQS